MIAAENRSVHPGIPGVPWWAAILIAATATATGAVLDAGGRELTSVFAVLYALGCLTAVLVVRQSALFTAVVQPPLILFVAVPGANYLFHRAEIAGIKDLLINCGYPLIERFLLMFCTAVAVLLIGMARWYFGSAKRHPTTSTPAPKSTPAAAAAAVPAAVAGFFAAFRSAISGRRDPDAQTAERSVRHSRAVGPDAPRPPRAPRAPRERPSSPRRSRHTRPPMDDIGGPAPQARRRRGESRQDADHRYRPPLEYGPLPRDPRGREAAREYPSRNQPVDHYGEPPRRPRAAEPSTHHPVSNVRYRGAPGAGDDHDPWRPSPRDNRRQ